MALRAPASLMLAALLAGTAHAATPLPVEAAHGMVVSSARLASEAGVAMLAAGGNAVDAAVAVGYAQAVVNPCCGNIGGGGFMVLHLAAAGAKPVQDRFINFRETAPAAADATMYLDAGGKVVPGASLYGWKAAAVPGTVLGLDTALQEYGRLTRAAVMAPAIRLASDGFTLTRPQTEIMAAKTAMLRHDPGAAKIYLRPDGTPLQPGDRMVQPDLARTLQAIADGGPDAFYKGPVATAVAAASAAGGGIMNAADLAAYRVTESAPVSCSYRGYTVMSAPPPSSGGVTLCEILDIVEGYDLKAMGFHSAASIHVLVEAMRHAYVDRNALLGDPAFVQNPLPLLLSKDYAAAIRGLIDPERPTPSKDFAAGLAPHEKPETTHYSVVDRDGNAVAVTYTLNGSFGAGVVAGDTGFLMNDEMDDFTIKPDTPNLYGLVQGARNAIAPGKRPLSSMSPSIVSKDGQLFLVTGSPGGSRIITAVLESIVDIVDYGMDPQAAVDAPRFHHQFLPDLVYVEPFALSPDTAALLRDRGYTLKEQTPWSAVELIERAPAHTEAGPPPPVTTASKAKRSAPASSTAPATTAGRTALRWGIERRGAQDKREDDLNRQSKSPSLQAEATQSRPVTAIHHLSSFS